MEELLEVARRVAEREVARDIPPLEQAALPEAVIEAKDAPPPGSIMARRRYERLDATYLTLSNGMQARCCLASFVYLCTWNAKHSCSLGNFELSLSSDMQIVLCPCTGIAVQHTAAHVPAPVLCLDLGHIAKINTSN